MDKLKKKFPHMYNRFLANEAGIEELRWVMDNYDAIKSDKPTKVKVKDHNILSIDSKGNHTFKTNH